MSVADGLTSVLAKRAHLLASPPVSVLMPPLSTSLPELRRMVEILHASIETATLLPVSSAGS